jgi:AraC-like DNA-binding protein
VIDNRFFEKQFLFRPAVHPGSRIPLRVRSIGLYGVEAGWRDVEKALDFVQLQWVLSGELEICAEKKSWRIAAGQSGVLFPGDRLRIRAVQRTRYRWLTVDGPLAENIVRAFGFGRDARPSGPCPEELYAELNADIRRITPKGQQRASALAYQIFCLAAEDNRPAESGTPAAEALEYIRQRFADPGLNVNTLAERLGTNRSSLSRAFRQAHGITVIHALTEQRIQAAVSLLREHNIPVAEAGRRCGFADPAYFSRVLKSRLGCGPRALRTQAP